MKQLKGLSRAIVVGALGLALAGFAPVVYAQGGGTAAPAVGGQAGGTGSNVATGNTTHGGGTAPGPVYGGPAAATGANTPPPSRSGVTKHMGNPATSPNNYAHHQRHQNNENESRYDNR
jgi:hypothetical protein